MAVLVTSTFGNQVYAKHTHSASGSSTGRSSTSPTPQLQSSPIRGGNNITSFVEECFTNSTGSALNITVNNASEIIGNCFYQYKLGHINKVTHHPISTLSSLLSPGQLVVTSIKHPPPKHSAAYNVGYKLGAADGNTGSAGPPDGTAACNSGTGINGTTATNQCLAGYFAAWNKYCSTSRYGCNS